MSPFHRAIYAVRGAFSWDNPWELLLDYHLLCRSDPIRLLKAGVSLVVNYRHSDMQAAKDVLLDGMYDNAFKVAFEGEEKAGDFRYLNLGANIGSFDLRACQFAKLHGRRLSGVAVEMNTATFARLVLNLEINSLLSIRPINAALANKDGEIICDLAARDTGQKAEGNEESFSSSEHSVPAVSWKTLWESSAGANGFDLVKVDIEGAERFVLDNLTPDHATRIRCIVIETHDSSLHALCDEKLPQLGFMPVQNEPGSPRTRVSLWTRHGSFG